MCDESGEEGCCIRGRWDHVDMTISFIATENKHSWFFVKWTQYLTVISHSPANMACDLAHGVWSGHRKGCGQGEISALIQLCSLEVSIYIVFPFSSCITLIREYLLEVKVRLLEQLSCGFNSPQLAIEFVQMLLDEYSTMCSALPSLLYLLEPLVSGEEVVGYYVCHLLEPLVRGLDGEEVVGYYVHPSAGAIGERRDGGEVVGYYVHPSAGAIGERIGWGGGGGILCVPSAGAIGDDPSDGEMRTGEE